LSDLGNDIKVLAITPHTKSFITKQKNLEKWFGVGVNTSKNSSPPPTAPFQLPPRGESAIVQDNRGENQRTGTPLIDKTVSPQWGDARLPDLPDRQAGGQGRGAAGGTIETVYIDTSLKVWDAFANLFSSESYHIKRFISEDFKNKLITILKNDNFDIIQLESLFVTPYIDCIRKYSNAKVVLRAHNVEFEIWERLTTVCKNPLKKAYLKLLTKRLRQYEINQLNSYDGMVAITHREINQLNSYDGMVAITHRDADIFKKMGCKVPITDIPVGIDISEWDENLQSGVFAYFITK